MLNRHQLDSIRRAALRDDWAVVGAIYLDLSLEAAMDRLHLEALAPLVQLRDCEKLIRMVDKTFENESRESS